MPTPSSSRPTHRARWVGLLLAAGLLAAPAAVAVPAPGEPEAAAPVPGDLAVPGEVIAPADPAEPADPAGPARPEDPAEPAEPADPAEPAQLPELSPAPAAPEAAEPDEEAGAAGPLDAVSEVAFVSLPWSPDIYEVTAAGYRVMTFAQWVDTGRPAPVPASIEYARVPWSDSVYGIVAWPLPAPQLVVVLSWREYTDAGRPGVVVRPNIPGTRYVQRDSSASEIHARTPDGRSYRLSYDQWVAAGSPVPGVEHGGFYRAAWSGDIHEVTPAGRVTRLSFAEWSALGSPSAALTPTRYVRTPWNADVYALITWPTSPADRAVHQVAHLGAGEFAAAGRPAVELVGRIPGDSWVRYTVADTIFHVVRGQLTPVSFSEWTFAGRPTPQVRAAPSPTYIRGILIVNKSLPVPASYGNGLTAATSQAFSAMSGAASREGLRLYIASGFRSYSYQQTLYNNYVASHGRAQADRFSARPGHSEHQTGLAFDVNTVSGSFGSTPEGRWVKHNAHRFGLIVRYPEGKEHITGYIYEPWHLRYVGTDVATHLYNTGLTLEEYLGVPSRY